MEPGQSSGTKARDGVWATLVPADSQYPEVDIRDQEAEICSLVTPSSSEKMRWCLITRDARQDLVVIKNIGTREIIVDDAIVDDGEAVEIKSGSKIITGSTSEECLHYTFYMLGNAVDLKNITMSLELDHLKCSICLNIWHDVVTVAPCLHNFCNGCFSQWLTRCQKNYQTVQCPQCRASILSIGRNHFLHYIEKSIFEKNPTLRRSDEDLALLDKCASIKSNLVLGTRKSSSRKRPSYSSSDINNFDIQCPQCVSEFGGFRCSQTTAHLQCHACGGMMPSRPDLHVPQICVGCDRTFCGAYWQGQGLNFGDIDRMCTSETFKRIVEHTVPRIPGCTHQNNQYEKSITERCMQQIGKPLQVVVSEHVLLLSNRQLDRTRMPLKHSESISPQTHICIDCYQKLVSYLLYWFRVTLPVSCFPPDVAGRENCWYGYACRTQHHNDNHAKQRNHVCRPTRGDTNAPMPS